MDDIATTYTPDFSTPLRSSLEERTPLLGKQSLFTAFVKRYRSSRKCFVAPEILAILFLNFLCHLIFMFFSNPSHVLPGFFLNCETYSHLKFPTLIKNIAKNACTATLYLVYPFAGYLADIRFGHYRVIMASLKILMPGLLMTLAGTGLLLVPYALMPDRNTGWLVLTTIGSILLIAGYLPLLIGIVGIGANIVVLGLDQFYDKPSDDQIVFILWYIWTTYFARLLIVFFSTLYSYTSNRLEIYYGGVIGAFAVVLLAIVGVYVFITWKKASIVTDYHASRENPYKLVYQVTQYARKNKLLINRGAFHEINHDMPSGLDAGMQKYGGPFSTNLVEDVKAFYGIFKVMVIGSSIFFFLLVSYQMNETLANHLTPEVGLPALNCSSTLSMSPREAVTQALSRALVVFIVPCYAFCLRPFVLYRMASSLKTIGIYLALTLPPIVVAFILDTYAHSKHQHQQPRCMFGKYPKWSLSNQTDEHYFPTSLGFKQEYAIYSTALINVYDCLIASMYVFFYRFICSQSPHSMKGFLVGLFFALTGFYYLASPLFALVIAYVWHHQAKKHISCGMAYYLVVIGLGVAAVLAFARTAHKYRYRRRVPDDYRTM